MNRVCITKEKTSEKSEEFDDILIYIGVFIILLLNVIFFAFIQSKYKRKSKDDFNNKDKVKLKAY